MSKVTIEVVGYTYRPCGPFPCDEDRSCGLLDCYKEEKLKFAFPALKDALLKKYGDDISVALIELDKEIPEKIYELVKKEHPPLPIILINGELAPIGAVSVPKISECIDSLLK